MANKKPGQRSGHNSQTKLLIIPNELREETECLKNSSAAHLQWLRTFENIKINIQIYDQSVFSFQLVYFTFYCCVLRVYTTPTLDNDTVKTCIKLN